MASSWTSTDWKAFEPGDIICNKKKQDFKRLIVYKDDIALYCIGFAHCALTADAETHPIFPMYFEHLERWKELTGEELMKLGNLKNYSDFISQVKEEVQKLSMKFHETD